MANTTIYVRNLDERVRLSMLTSTLEDLCSLFGPVVEIIAKPNVKAKGQAFVVFQSPEHAARAVEDLQGFELWDKPMSVDFARTRSDATVKRDGNAEELELHRRRRLAEKERKQALEAATTQQKLKRGAPDSEPTQRPIKTSKLKSTASAAVIPDEYLPPNKILFVQNLPHDYDVENLEAIFARFAGFKEVRPVPYRPGIAFVEYEAEDGAISAKESVAGMELGDEGKPMKVTFQRQ
ncbi:RNA-binding domain-containing protein [Pseudovirgaria hyperparasitica]|uniref:RNA-binding domain-containing protein n=1 Tax=Pseudovirgaria hyperparasitica TaxID=470096 RepID=A0A6A6VUS8_9PEZI|nr:RNA-binding domain-containing protein [Pseudovirgaria hyperparasitica]KAF2754438.1 RNA-binding domain-containing protein [Pseudovirgaria hyperparasitica]